MAALYEEMKPFCSAERPFLDVEYAWPPPFTDFTSILAKWISEQRFPAITELWIILFGKGIAELELLRRALKAQVDTGLKFDSDTVAEVKAINLLVHGMHLHLPGHPSSIASRLFATRLASIEWNPPIDQLASLKFQASKEAWVPDGSNKRKRQQTKANEALAELLLPRNEAIKTVGDWMLLIPPMTRMVIQDYFQKTWEVKSLTPNLYYMDRMYGCCKEINLGFIRWMGCFREPDDRDILPSRVTKTLLLQEFTNLQLTVKKTLKRTELIETLRDYPGVISKLIKIHAPESVTPKTEWKQGLENWASRCQIIQCVAAAIMARVAQTMLNTNLKGAVYKT